MNEEQNSQEEQTPILKRQENDPEKMLPAGHISMSMKIIYLLIINVVVFGAIYGISRILFVQSNETSLMFAEIITGLSLVGSIVFMITKKNK